VTLGESEASEYRGSYKDFDNLRDMQDSGNLSIIFSGFLSVTLDLSLPLGSLG